MLCDKWTSQLSIFNPASYEWARCVLGPAGPRNSLRVAAPVCNYWKWAGQQQRRVAPLTRIAAWHPDNPHCIALAHLPNRPIPRRLAPVLQGPSAEP